MIDVEHADHTLSNYCSMTAFLYFSVGMGAGEEYDLAGDGTGVGEDHIAADGSVSGDGLCLEHYHQLGVADHLRQYISTHYSCARGL